MPQLLRDALALLAGLVVGSLVNMALVTASPVLIPPPAGVEVKTAEGWAAGMHLLEPRHFLMPFLAHALGTLVGALTAFLLAASHPARFAYGIGALFLLGGVAACFLIPAPRWFMAVDLLLAYLPMAWLAVGMGRRLRRNRP